MTKKRFFSTLLTVIGAMVCLLSGGCCIAALTYFGGADNNVLTGMLIYGGIPFLCGLGLYFWGKKLKASGAADKQGESK